MTLLEQTVQKIALLSEPDGLYSQKTIDDITALLTQYTETVLGTKKVLVGNKKHCDCPCKGAFCNNFVHQCDKPSEHFTQFEESELSIQNKLLETQYTRAGLSHGEKEQDEI